MRRRRRRGQQCSICRACCRGGAVITKEKLDFAQGAPGVNEYFGIQKNIPLEALGNIASNIPSEFEYKEIRQDGLNALDPANQIELVVSMVEADKVSAKIYVIDCEKNRGLTGEVTSLHQSPSTQVKRECKLKF